MMKDYIKKCKDWHAQLAPLEKRAVNIGGVILGIFLVYELTLAQLHQHVTSLREQITAKQKMLTWMQGADKEIQKIENHTQNKTKTITPVLLLSLLQKQINHAGLEQALTQLKQATNDSVEMHLQKVPFDKLIGLLTTVIKENNVSITQMSALADDVAGMVNADVFMKIG